MADTDILRPTDRRRRSPLYRLLEQAGHIVEPAAPEYDAEAFHNANFGVWNSFLAAGVLRQSGGRLHLTREGMLVANEVMQVFV